MLTQKLLYLYALLLQFRRIGLVEHGVKLPVSHRLAATLRTCKQLCQHRWRKRCIWRSR